jgi:glycosyltransferase involved in cell wall biosynthesis
LEEDTTAASGNVRFGLVTPVRDEEEFIGAMIESVVAQTTLPLKWIIVDDGSRDRSAEIIQSYAEQYGFIRFLQLPPREQRYFGGESAASVGLRELAAEDLDYIARFDADLVFPPDHFARIFKKCLANPRIGIAGGGLYIKQNGVFVLEKHSSYHVRGAIKVYRRQCLEVIGGLGEGMGWDTLDEVTAWVNGWDTRSFEDVEAIHQRPTGQAIPSDRLYHARGRAEFLTWSHPLFVFGKAVKIGFSEGSIMKPAFYLTGFLTGYIRGEERIHDPEIAKARRAQQWRLIVEMIVHPRVKASNKSSINAFLLDPSIAAESKKRRDVAKVVNGILCPWSQ